MQPFFTIITCYHFGQDHPDYKSWLVPGLKNTLEQISGRGRLILVANGTQGTKPAVDPTIVMRELDGQLTDLITSQPVLTNRNYPDGLNKGVEVALAGPSHPNEWIGSIQPSVRLSHDWFEAATKLILSRTNANGVYGRLMCNGRNWADGHRICNAVGQMNKVDDAYPDYTKVFPCLSACVFSRRAVETVVARYGSFVNTSLDVYGDCPDVALRIREVDGARFVFQNECYAKKRRHSFDQSNLLLARIVTAMRYYGKTIKSVAEAKEYRLTQGLSCTESEITSILDLAHEKAKEPYAEKPIAPPVCHWEDSCSTSSDCQFEQFSPAP